VCVISGQRKRWRETDRGERDEGRARENVRAMETRFDLAASLSAVCAPRVCVCVCVCVSLCYPPCATHTHVHTHKYTPHTTHALYSSFPIAHIADTAVCACACACVCVCVCQVLLKVVLVQMFLKHFFLQVVAPTHRFSPPWRMGTHTHYLSSVFVEFFFCHLCVYTEREETLERDRKREWRDAHIHIARRGSIGRLHTLICVT